VDPSNRGRVESWLHYSEDLGLGPYYRDRAASPSFNDAASAPSASSAPAPTMEMAEPKRAAAPAPPALKPIAPSGFGTPAKPVAPPPSLFEIVDRVQDDSLDRIREDIGDCMRCRLHKGRTKIVFGVGNPKAELMFVGEGPGRDEDIQGEPFVGRAGKLLTQMIEAMGLRREDVYIANVVKCRPPENRLPEKDEIAICSPFLMRQIDVIRPKVICCLGSCSAQTLLATTQGISRFRGEWFDFRGAKLIPTYHPAYLLRNPAAKSDVWKDLQKVMAHLGLQPKRR
jgi:uracil-DNA glycosylase